MVSPTSTNPKTTLNRPFAFRTCFLDNFQGEVMANFAVSELKAEKAAVLFNVADAYPRGLAEFFKKSFEKQRGPGSVVAFEKFLSSEKDYSHYFEKIVSSDADVLFIPQYSDEIPMIIKQARKNGWKKAIFGGDAWESSDLMAECGDVCKGLYFCSHFGAVGAAGKAKIFVEQFEKKNSRLPTANAALSYDSVDLVLTAIRSLKSLSGNLIETRQALKDKLAAIRSYEGVSGSLDMNSTGDPTKSAVVLRINDKGEFESYKIENP
jgi:branched-chain amino acid transport system substrate-binding protein